MGFNLGSWNIDVVSRIEQKRQEYPSCDSEGQEITIERARGKTEYKNKEGVIISKIYRLINGKPFDKFKKTSKVSSFTEVPKTEVYDLITECCYLCKSNELKEHLKKEDKAIKFIYTNGNGYKGYVAYLTTYQDRLVMYLGFGSVIQQIKAIESQMVEEVQQEVIERASPELLLVQQVKKKGQPALS